jgi:hypothetical protein
VHVAGALGADAPLAPCGLATLAMFEGEGEGGALVPRGGMLAVPDAPGLL